MARCKFEVPGVGNTLIVVEDRGTPYHAVIPRGWVWRGEFRRTRNSEWFVRPVPLNETPCGVPFLSDDSKGIQPLLVIYRIPGEAGPRK